MKEMTVTVYDVRSLLGNLDTSLVDDATIQQHIETAREYVAKYVSETHSLYDACVRYRAAYYTLVTYAEIARREVGDLPAGASMLMEEYKRIADELLKAAMESSENMTTTEALTLTTASWWDYAG